MGADLVAYSEAAELAEKGFLTSSCCPAFVSYVHNEFPTLVDNVSHNPPPWSQRQRTKENAGEEVKTIFIGPCTAKKNEFRRPEVSQYVDCVLTFEELQALLTAATLTWNPWKKKICTTPPIMAVSLARCGGLSDGSGGSNQGAGTGL